MPPRPSITSSLAKLSLRGLQTTAPLPPPTTPLPPSNVASSSSSISSAISHLPPILPPSSKELPTNTSSAISLISSQSTPASGRYIIARLHSRNYLLHPKDILTIPLLKPIQSPGSTLSLTKILEIGSRDYSLRSQASNAPQIKREIKNWKEKKLSTFQNIPSNLVNCQLTVLEHTKSPMERILKKKRRKGYKKTIEHKQAWTRLRVGDIVLGGDGEVASI